MSGLDITVLAAGTCTIDADQAGNAEYAAATTVSQTFTIHAADTTTAVSTDGTPTVFGQSVTFTAHVASAAGVPAGSVEFSIDGNPVTSGPVNGSGDATFSTSTLTVAHHTVDAVFTPGTGDYSGSNGSLTGGQDVTAAGTSTTVSSSVTPSSVFGQDVTFTATVAAAAASSATPAGSVEFFDGTTSLGTTALVAGQASVDTATLSAGDHSITAVFTDGGDFNGSTSDAITQTVAVADTTTSVSSVTGPSVFGQDVTFSATVAAVAPSTATPVGSVEFFDGVDEPRHRRR